MITDIISCSPHGHHSNLLVYCRDKTVTKSNLKRKGFTWLIG